MSPADPSWMSRSCGANLRRKSAALRVGGANQFLTSLVAKIAPVIPTAVDGRGVDAEVAVPARIGATMRLTRSLVLLALPGGAALLIAVLLIIGGPPATGPSRPHIEPTVTLPPIPALRPGYIAEGEQVYAQYCAACHGRALEGQPNWKQPLPSGKYPAPPHDDSGHTWHHDDELLRQIIREGGNGTGGAMPSDMPAFGHVLTERQIDAVLEYIKSHWSPASREYQWRMTMQRR